MLKCEVSFSSRKICFYIIFFPIIFSLYPHFIHPLYTIIKRYIAYIQNYIANAKDALYFLHKKSGVAYKWKSMYLLNTHAAIGAQLLATTPL